MSEPGQFARECEATARALRRLPSEVRRAFAADVKSKVADPLARRIAGAASGPWAAVLAAGTKSRASGDPQIVVGGQRPKVSGGAGPRALIFGTEFGGGKRRGYSTSRRGRRYARATTNQFARNQRPFVFDTVSESVPAVLDAYAEIVETTFDREVGSNG